MNEWQSSTATPHVQFRMTSGERALFEGLRDEEYRRELVSERVRASIALQIQALRTQRDKMTQTQLGKLLGKAQPWISKLEDPEYGKVTVATLLEVADAFDVDLEIKFRPFSKAIRELSSQRPDYYDMPSFSDEEDRLAAESEQARGGIAASDTSVFYRPAKVPSVTTPVVPISNSVFGQNRSTGNTGQERIRQYA